MIFHKNGDVDIRDDLYMIIDRYGVSAQVDIAIEEMSELTKALLKNRRNCNDFDRRLILKDEILKYRDDIIEEIADVSIILEQLKIIYDCETEVKEQIIYKIKRQLDRM